MGKQQLSTIDIAAEVACLRRRILGMNLINVFDINPKTYVLKLGTSGEAAEKVFVLVESGSRLHTTQYDRTRSDFPSNMNLKLRKHIRNRRLNDVRQLGVDRIVDFTFGHEEKAVHLILEMYAQGNLVLADHKYEVLTLLRTHTDSENKYALMPKRPYPVQHIRMSKPVSEMEIADCFFRTCEKRSLKSIVTELLPFGAACAEHVLLSAGLESKNRFPSEERDADADVTDAKVEFMKGTTAQKLLKEIRNLEHWFHNCNANPPPGFILTKEAASSTQQNETEKSGTEVYLEFEPFLLLQHQDRSHISFDTFDAALDEFFSKREGQKMALAKVAAEQAAEARLLKTKQDLEMRAQKLHEVAAEEDLQGQLIEYNLDIVDETLLAVNSVLASGMSWDEVKSLIKNESDEGNPIAGRVYSLQLEQNAVTLVLEDVISHGDDEQVTPRLVKVVVDLGLGAAANARVHFEKRKKHAMKEQKTHEANASAIKAAEMKVQAQLQKTKPVVSLHQLRKTHWFEKFYWFITSENYLVVSGKDAQQNELLVKRYMMKDDIYVHADVHGASTTIIKNYKPGIAISPVSLHQAGVACVCRSKAWDGKQITSAWWVFPDQVSKTAPTGEYLTTGSFMIRGKKNYLPPATLTYGFGFLFKLEDASVDRHKGERAPKIAEELPTGHSLVESEKAEGKSRDEDLDEAKDLEKSALDVFLDESVDHLSTQLGRRLTIDSSETHVVGSATGTQGPAPGREQRRPKEHESVKKTLQEEEVTDTVHQQRENRQESLPGGTRRQGKKKGKRRGKDEEDLRLMTELLQSTGTKKTRQQRREERKQKKAAKHSAFISQADSTATEQEIKETIAKATEAPYAPEQVPSKEASTEDAGSSESAVELEEEEEEQQQMSSNQTEIHQLDSLTGNPLAEDTLLFAVPCCGPYDSLVHCKYKVKLLPGTLKKGKGGKQAVELLTHSRDISQRDLQLMKDVPETEVTNTMLGSVKLAMPGMQKIKQSQKSKKKKK